MVTVHGNYAQFRFFRPQAKMVQLVGDFNGWRKGEHEMVRTDDGYWLAALHLKPGTYKFRYCADGKWFTDYAAFGIEYGPLGVDSIVRVLELPQPALTPAEEIAAAAPAPRRRAVAASRREGQAA